MKHPITFGYLKVDEYLPKNFQSSEDYQDLVEDITSKGRIYDGLSPRLCARLMVRLLQTEPFREVSDNEIRIPSNAKSLPCPNWRMLIEELSWALLQYEYDCRSFDWGMEAAGLAVDDSLRIVQDGLEFFLHHRKNIPGSKRQRELLQAGDTLRETFNDVAEAVRLSVKFRKRPQLLKTNMRKNLYLLMRDACETYIQGDRKKGEIDNVIGWLFSQLIVGEDSAPDKIGKSLGRSTRKRSKPKKKSGQ